jgi:two-component system LytT family response regulator
MIKAIIVEDELNAREELEFLLNQIGGVEVVKKCANALEGIKAVNTLKPDLMFLDIQLPVIDGFEMLSMIEESLIPQVVFVTAYDEFAVKAFEKDALDYILKPVELQRLKKTVEKVTKAIEANSKPEIEIPALKKIPVYGNRRIKLVEIDSVELVRSDQTGVYLHCAEGKKCYSELTLKALETRTNFFRCHKQFLVNLSKITELILEENSSGKVKTTSGYTVPVSRRFLKLLKEKLGIL